MRAPSWHFFGVQVWHWPAEQTWPPGQVPQAVPMHPGQGPQLPAWPGAQAPAGFSARPPMPGTLPGHGAQRTSLGTISPLGHRPAAQVTPSRAAFPGHLMPMQQPGQGQSAPLPVQGMPVSTFAAPAGGLDAAPIVSR